MSGIGAIFWKHRNNTDALEVERLVQGLRVYGPDRQHKIETGPCALVYAHCSRTKIHDVDAGPVRGGDGRFAMVFDGRLDNRAELEAMLGVPNRKTLTDGELVMLGWEKWQKETPRYLAGPFVFLVWDQMANTLFAIRDHLGKYGLSFHETSERIVVATAPKALFGVSGVPRQADMQKVADQLVQLFHDGERSFYKDVSRIMPAHVMTVTAERSSQSRYWNLQDVPAIKPDDPMQLVEQGKELLAAATINCLRGSKNPASLITGGLDSSSVAVTALDHLPAEHTLTTYTSVPMDSWDGRCSRGAYGDETPFVKAIADMHPRLKPQFVKSEGLGMFHLLDDFIDVAGVAPRNTMNFFWIHDIHERASAAGHDVLLDGSMGNATLSWSGEGIYLDLLRKGRLRKLCSELFREGRKPRELAWVIYNKLFLPALPQNSVKFLRWAREGFPSWPLWALYSAMDRDAFARMNMQDRMDKYNWNFFTSGPFGKEIRQELMASAMVMEQADIMMGFKTLHRIDMRDPLADLRLTQWCFGLDEEAFRHKGHGRGLIRQIMHGKLPEVVLNNKASGSQAIDWHIRMSADLDMVADELSAIDDDADTSGLVDVKRLRALVRQWPDKDPLSRIRPDTTAAYHQVALPSAIAAGRLVRKAKGANR
ncbi:MAG: asparagine synthetase B [Anderseniella sp.]